MPVKSTQGIPILIASTLKSTKDTRAWEKFGLSLCETNKYTINIIGFSGKKIEKKEGVNFYSSLSDTNSKRERLLAQWRFLKLLFKIRPKLVICCTYEYLPIATRLKTVLGYKLVYDVQENYVANLALNPSLSEAEINRNKAIIQKAESSPGIDLFLLAEKCYSEEMPKKKPYLIFENKFCNNINYLGPRNLTQKKSFSFLISGTITPVFGIKEGIKWFLEIAKKYPESRLQIIGHVPIKSFHKEVQDLVKNETQIQLSIDSNPLPHEEILAAYSDTDFLLSPYQNHPAISSKTPTKFFEAIAFSVPILHPPNSFWANFLSPYQAGYSVVFSDLTRAQEIFEEITSTIYYPQKPEDSVLWKSDEKRFLTSIDQLINS